MYSITIWSRRRPEKHEADASLNYLQVILHPPLPMLRIVNGLEPLAGFKTSPTPTMSGVKPGLPGAELALTQYHFPAPNIRLFWD